MHKISWMVRLEPVSGFVDSRAPTPDSNTVESKVTRREPRDFGNARRVTLGNSGVEKLMFIRRYSHPV